MSLKYFTIFDFHWYNLIFINISTIMCLNLSKKNGEKWSYLYYWIWTKFVCFFCVCFSILCPSVSLHFIIYIIMYNHSCSFNEINETNVSMYTADSIVPLRPHPYSVDFHVQFKREPFPHELVMNADSVLVMS